MTTNTYIKDVLDNIVNALPGEGYSEEEINLEIRTSLDKMKSNYLIELNK